MSDEFPAPPQSFFQTAYDGPPPPWEIGRPQATFLALADRGVIRGRVLDVGCGTGALSVELAARGLTVTGIDFAERAIDEARARASERGVAVDFRVASALALPAFAEPFDTVTDVGVYHGFTDDDQATYRAGLASVTLAGSRLVLQCFSDRERGKVGPRRLTEAQLRAGFAEGWHIESLEPVRYETLVHDGGADGWLMIAVRE